MVKALRYDVIFAKSYFRYMRLKFLLIILGFVVIISCDKEDINPVPDVYFSISIEIQNDPQFFYLRSQDNAMEILAGDLGLSNLGYANNGIIIYNAGSNQFFAFDRTCPHDVHTKTAIELTDNNIATCPVCESKYVLPNEGIPSSGSESKYYLKRYKTQYNASSGVLYVHN